MNANILTTDHIRQHLETARQKIAQNKLQEAAQTLNEAQRIQPNDARVFMLAGLMAEQSGNVKKALESLRTCVALAPNWGPGMLELALLLARQNQFNEAMKWAEDVAALEPKNPKVLAGVVDIAHRSGNLEMAVRHLERGLQQHPGDQQLMAHLSQDLAQLQRYDESLKIIELLITQEPTNPEFLVSRIQTLLVANRAPEALPSTTTLIGKYPNDEIAQYYHQIAQGKVPAQQPAALYRSMFDNMASSYDMHMVRGLRYQLPKLVAAKIMAHHPDKKLNILDLGCGTGLLGIFLGKPDGFLIGVDTSEKMIEQAARHNLYDRFHMVDLRDALRETPDDLYDAITALDVFIYTGDVSEAISNAFRILRAGGAFYFSCETTKTDANHLVLQASGRYAHSEQSIKTLCSAAGFLSVHVEEHVLRYESDQPVQGFLVIASKAAT